MELVPESGALPQDEAAAAKSSLDKSLLDKPLHKLTEDDIAQVTREDCRRYLKEKGMRRPSWNKSQAIQQVIMLKALLEPPADADADYRKKLRLSRTNKLHDDDTLPENFPHGTSGDANISVVVDDISNYGRKDLEELDNSRGFSARSAAASSGSALPRTTVSTNMPVGQMTIFYSGKVNVYDDVPADKARVIMHVAANPLHFPQDQAKDGSVLLQSSSHLSKSVHIKACPDSTLVHFPTVQTVKVSDNGQVRVEERNLVHEEYPVDGGSNRKACLQRYLEKRKDRFKSKRKAGITSCTSLDTYFNHQMAGHLLNEPFVGSDTWPLSQIRQHSTPIGHNLVDYEFVKNVCTSSGPDN